MRAHHLFLTGCLLCGCLALAACQAPTLRIVSPAPGAMVHLNHPVTLAAEASDPDGRPVTISWSIPRENVSRSGWSASMVFRLPGTVRIKATAVTPDGAGTKDSVDIQVVNSPPEVHIEAPADGATVYRGIPVRLAGFATDVNKGPGPGPGLLDDAHLTWSSGQPRDWAPVSGASAEVTFTTTGRRRIRLAAFDPQLLTSYREIEVNVVEPPPDAGALPVARITSPANRAEFGTSLDVLPLRASVQRTDGGAAAVHSAAWTAEWNTAAGSRARAIGDGLELDWRPADAGVTCSFPYTRIILRLRVTGTAGNEAGAMTVVTLICPP